MKFFRIILHPIHDHSKLQLPNKFVRAYGDRLPEKVTLVVPGGREWRVTLVRKEDGRVCLRKGWPEFGESLGLQFGHLLMFKYKEAEREFRVDVMDKTTCEIQYPSVSSEKPNASPVDEPVPESDIPERSEEQDDDDAVQISSEEEVRPSARRGRRSGSPVGRRGAADSKKRVRTSTESPVTRKRSKESEAGEAAMWAHQDAAESDQEKEISDEETLESSRTLPESDGEVRRYVVRGRVPPGATGVQTKEAYKRAEAFEYEGPVLIIGIQKSYTSGSSTSQLYVPKVFITRCMASDVTNITLKIRGGQRSWSVRCGFIRKQAYFCGGWKKFARENHLAFGDVCAFELVNGARNSLQVTIFRACRAAENEDSEDQAGTSGKATPFSRKRARDHPYSISASKAANRGPSRGRGTRTTWNDSIKEENEGGVRYVVRGKVLPGATGDQSIEAFKRAEAFVYEGPVFIIWMQKSYLYGNNPQLYVPKAFITRYFASNVTNISLEIGGGGRSWSVFCGFAKTRAYFYNGWKRFAKENGLTDGDVCAFELVKEAGNLLQVRIFRASRAARNEDSDGHTEISGKATPFSRKRPRVPCSNSPRAISSSSEDEEEEEAAYERPIMVPAWRVKEAQVETRRAFRRAEAFKSRNPTVALIMHRCFVTPPAYQLGLPKSFVKRCFNLGSNKLLLKVAGKDCMTWSAKYTISKRSNAKVIGRGWKSLVTAKRLEVGDVCVFEVVGGSENLVQVHIFRHR